MFHDGIVDAFACDFGEGLGVWLEHARRVGSVCYTGGNILGHLRAVAGEFLAKNVGAKRKYPGIPDEAALGQKLLGFRRIRLLDETGNLAAIAKRCAALDIAVTRFRPRRLHPDRNQPSFSRKGRSLLNGCMKGILVCNVVVARTGKQDAVRRDARCRKCDGGSRIAGRRFEDECDFIGLFFDQRSMVFARNDNRFRVHRAIGHPV